MNLVKCPKCSVLISSRAIKTQIKSWGWKGSKFNRPIQCDHCGAFLKLSIISLLLGLLILTIGVYGIYLGESLPVSFTVVGLIIVFGILCRLGLSHTIIDENET